MALTLRTSKGSPLTHTELDDNFTYLSSSIANGGGTNLTVSGSFAAERVIISGNTSSAAPGGLATTENIRVWADNGGFAIGGSQGLNGVQGVGLVISETPSNGNHVILSDGSGSNLNLRAAGGDAGDSYVVVLADQAGTQESDVFEIAKFGGPFRRTELYHTGSLVFNTAEIGANKAIVVTGTISASAEVYLSGLANTSTPNIVGFDTATGKLSYYSTGSFGGGGSTDYVSNVTLVGSNLTFTGVGSAFNSTVNLSSLSGSSVDITALNNFTGSANTRLGNLEAATGSFVTNTQTGSFLYSGSYNSAASAITLYSANQNYTLDLSGLAGGGGGFPITASDEGSDLTNSMSKIDFVGNAVTATSVGSIVTVTINTGSAASATDITALNNFTGSAQTSLDALNAATASYVTNDETGSFYYSSSVSLNTITFYQGDGTTENVTIDTGSAVVNTGSLMVTGSVSNDTLTFTKGDGNTFPLTINNVNNAVSASYYDLRVQDSLTTVLGTSKIDFGTYATVTEITPGVAEVTIISASYAPNLYNTDGTLSGARTVTQNGNGLTFNGQGAFNTFDISSGGRFNISGSTNVKIQGLQSGTQANVIGIDSQGLLYVQSTGSFSGGAAATDTGSFYYSSSVALNTVTFYQGDGTTEAVTINTGSDTNIGNANQTLTGNRTLNFAGSSLTFDALNGETFNIAAENSATVSIALDASTFQVTGLTTGDNPQVLGIAANGVITAMNTSSFGGGGGVSSVTVSGSNGVSGSGTITSSGTIVLQHADTSAQGSVNNSGNTFIQDITLDGFGHVTGLTSATVGATQVNSSAIYAESTTGFNVHSYPNYEVVNINATNIEANAPKTVGGDTNRLLAIATMEVGNPAAGLQNCVFSYELYNSTQTLSVAGSQGSFSGYLLPGEEGAPNTTFTFTLPINDTNVNDGDTIQLRAKAYSVGTYASASIYYASLTLLDIE